MAYNDLIDDDEAQVAMPTGRYAARSASPLMAAATPTAPMRPDAFAAALPDSYRNLYSAMNANLADYNTQRALIEAPQREKLEAYTKALRERQAGPSAGERLLALGSAFFQPTPYRGVAGTLSNVAPVLAEQMKAARAAKEAQDELALKYDLDMAKMTAEEKMATLKGQTDLRSRILGLMAKTGQSGQAPRIAVDALGRALHPNLGYPLPQPGNERGQVPIAAIQFMLSQNDPAVDAEFDKKYNAPGFAKLIRDTRGLNSGIAAESIVTDADEE